jgi:hypothetical protein
VKRIDLIANLCVIVASVSLLGFLGNSWWDNHHPGASPEARALIGSALQLPGVNFAQQNQTLVLAISSSCPICRHSEPFYRQLANTAPLKTHLIAVLPQSQSEAERYVASSISPALQVVSTPLDAIGVNGTPTLLLVDNHGKVQKAWIGKLDDPGEKQVQSEL